MNSLEQHRRRTLAGLFGLAFALPAHAAELLVTSLADGSGSCPGPNCTLRDALATVDFGDVIKFDPSLDYPAVIELTGGSLLVDRDAIVDGPGADLLAISANNKGRVLTILTGVSTKWSGLTLQNGRIALSTEPFVPTAKGGCILIQEDSLLRLEDSAVRKCSLRGGDGRDGINVDNCFDPWQSRGGDGGIASGGAIHTAGRLALLRTSISQVTAKGGDGGDGGKCESYDSDASDGGYGGQVHGAAITVTGANGSLEMYNSSILDVVAAGGNGGNGASNVNKGGDGGYGGSISGGVIAVLNGVAEVGFSTLVNASAVSDSPGSGGHSELGVAGLDGFPGAIAGQVWYAHDAELSTIKHTALVASPVSTQDEDVCNIPLTTSGINFATDNSCGTNLVAPYAISFPMFSRRQNGLDELAPLSTSIIVDMATDCTGLGGVALSSDQGSRIRPFDGDGDGVAFCDIGAVERDGSGYFADRVFDDGFEID